MDQLKPIKDPLEIIIREFCDKIQIEALRNGNTKLPVNGYRTAVLDLSHENILYNINLNLKFLVSLNLSHCELTYLPNLFDQNSHLKELNVSYNHLSEVPQAIFDSLELLEQLDLSHNKIERFEGLPKCFCKLRILRLNNNCLINIPECILNVCCLNLEELYYSNNEISSMTSSKFLYRGPYKLKKIEFRNCLVHTEDWKYLKQIRTLRELDISNEDVKNRNLLELCINFEGFFENAMWDDQLHVLNFSNLQIADLPTNISLIVNLQELNVSKNHIMWLPESLGLLKRLKVLDVSENNLFSFPISISNMEHLEVLKASCNKISYVFDFANLNIKHLDLYDNCLDNCCSVNWDNVLQIDLEYNYFNTHSFLRQYQEKKTALRQDLKLHRKDEPKEIIHDAESDNDYSSGTPDNESYEDGQLGEFNSEFEQESWSFTKENCDNGCTTSDNEWTGTEKPIVKRKTIKRRRIPRPPSWMLADVE